MKHLFSSNYKRLAFTNMMAMILIPFMSIFAIQVYGIDDNGGGGTVHQQKEHEKLITQIKDQVKELIKESNAGFLSKEDFKKQFDELKTEYKHLPNSEDQEKLMNVFNNVETQITDFEAKHQLLAKELQKIKEQGGVQSTTKSLKDSLAEFFATDEFKAYAAKGNGKIGFEAKDISLTSNYTGGTILISTNSDRHITPQERSINMRDIMPVEQTDLPYLVFDEIYEEDYDLLDVAGENDVLGESTFKVREKQSAVTRLGTYIKISKRMLKSVTWLTSHLSRVLPKKLKAVEDFQLLFGDGAGNNLDGIVKNATAFDLTGLIFGASDIASIETYNGGAQTLVNFGAVHALKNGDLITFASTSSYNNEYISKIKTSKQILIDAAYSAQGTSAWTATSKNPLYHKIDNANEIDVLVALRGLLKRGEFEVSGYVINPLDGVIMESLKTTTAEYLGVERGNDGVLRIGGLPVVETTAIPAGEFLGGDFQLALSLLEFTAARVEFADDVTYKLKNQVAVIIEEEVIFPIFNSLMFMYGDFTSAKAELETT